MITILMIMDLVAREGVEDMKSPFMRYRCRVVFDSYVSLSLRIPYKIETMIHKLIKPVSI